MRRRRGFILVLAVLLSSAMFFFALMYLNAYLGERQIGGQGESQMIAWEAASAGTYAAALQLKQSSAWNAGFNAVSLPASGATYTVTFAASSSLPYSTNNALGTAAVTGWSGRVVPAGTIHVVCVGRAGTATQVEQAMMVPAQAPFGFGLFGVNQLTVGNNTVVDSYNSGVGAYPAGLDLKAGNVGTNATGAGKVTLNAGAVVNGQVQVGPGGTAAVIKGSGTYQGLMVPSQAWPSSAVSAQMKNGTKNFSVTGTSTLAPGAWHDINVGTNETLVLQQGSYVIHNLTLGDGAKIVLSSGPVTWWYSGNQQFGKNCQINTSGKPSDLSVQANGTSNATVSINAGTTANFTLYAPYSTLNVTAGAELFGSFLAKNITTSNGTTSAFARIHLDVALAKQTVQFNILTRF